MPKNDDEDIEDLLKKLKNAESNDYPGFENRRGKFVRQIFLSRFFIIVILLLLALICVLSQGISF